MTYGNPEPRGSAWNVALTFLQDALEGGSAPAGKIDRLTGDHATLEKVAPSYSAAKIRAIRSGKRFWWDDPVRSGPATGAVATFSSSPKTRQNLYPFGGYPGN